jgi:hypothetical protein
MLYPPTWKIKMRINKSFTHFIQTTGIIIPVFASQIKLLLINVSRSYLFTTLKELFSKNCLRLLTAISIKRCLDSFGAHEI